MIVLALTVYSLGTLLRLFVVVLRWTRRVAATETAAVSSRADPAIAIVKRLADAECGVAGLLRDELIPSPSTLQPTKSPIGVTYSCTPWQRSDQL